MTENTETGSAALLPAGELPALPFEAWRGTHDTLHLWTQVVGKIRLALAPMLNHWWQSTLYLTPRGLTTSPMPCGSEAVQIDFDFFDHQLLIQSSSGASRTMPLAGHSVASFYHGVMDALRELGVETTIWTVPVEVDVRIPFEQDETHAQYDPEYAHRFWRALFLIDRVLKTFRARFTGKASPVHFFFGSFDLAATRYSGRPAPLIQSAYHVALYVMRETYVREESSCGFWPGEGLGEPAFYAYTYPEPVGYREYPVQPAEAYYHPTLREFILPYDAVRASPRWEEMLTSFLQSTYEAGANLASWDRDALENSYLIRRESA
ncbi:MAG TPA: DUF5996 family protein [Anaerolineaceae bacterium]